MYNAPILIVVICMMLFMVGIVSITYAFSKCGVEALLLGDGAVYAAVTGMCDE